MSRNWMKSADVGLVYKGLKAPIHIREMSSEPADFGYGSLPLFSDR